jgi:cation diffusion facilitator CzcD-associated flavoprotein CzcO
MELWEQGAETTMAVRGGVHIVPRDPFRFPVQVLAATLFDHLPVATADRLATALLARPYRNLASYGIRPPAIGPGARAAKEGRLPTVDTGTIELIRQGMIRIVPEPSSFDETGITFSDGRSLPFDVVVLATGFHGGLDDFLPDAARYTDSRGSPLWHGDTGPIPGLYFVGFRNSISGPLRELGVEAARVVACLQRS